MPADAGAKRTPREASEGSPTRRTSPGAAADEAPGMGLEDDLHLVTGAGDLAGYSGCRERSGARPNAEEDQDL